MGDVRGLKNRLCPRCNALTPHRSLYARVTAEGKRRWMGLFWACEKCHSLNHVVLPLYSLGSLSSPLATLLAVRVVKALEEGPLDFNELVARLRQEQPPQTGHIFKAAVTTVLEFLKGRGVVTEEQEDHTEDILAALKLRRLGVCPVESKRTLISLYAQKQGGAASEPRFVSAGAYCTSCSYHQEHLV